MERTIIAITLCFVCLTTWAQTQGGYVRRNNTSSQSKSKTQQKNSEATKVSKTKTTTQIKVKERVENNPNKTTNVVGYGNKTVPLKKRAFTKDDVGFQYSSYTIPESIGEYSINSIGDEAFRGSEIKTISIPSSVNRIEQQAFRTCKNLTSIFIPKNIEYIGGMAFCNCPNLESIIVEKGNPNYDSRDDCNAIIETKNNELIVGCKNTVIPNTVVSIGVMAFWGCRELTSITIPESVNKIYGSALGDCANLSIITIDRNNPVYDSRHNCNAIIETKSNKLIRGCKNTIIPTDSEIFIENSAFVFSSIKEITIPKNVRSIGKKAFEFNKELKSVTSLSILPPELGEKAFDRINEKAVLYIPQGTKAAYDNAGWSQYFSKIVEQSD